MGIEPSGSLNPIRFQSSLAKNLCNQESEVIQDSSSVRKGIAQGLNRFLG